MTRRPLADFPLRERKRAQTRVALVEALVSRLGAQPLEAIQISELAAQVGVSQATVFNYFPTKGHILARYVQLWSLEVSALARRIEAEHRSALRAIEALFVATAEQSEGRPRLLLEIIAHQARRPADFVLESVELVERLTFLGDDVEAPEALSDRGLGEILPRLVGAAVARGELPPSTDVGQVTVAVAAVFFGVALITDRECPGALAERYRDQLTLIWAGARA